MSLRSELSFFIKELNIVDFYWEKAPATSIFAGSDNAYSFLTFRSVMKNLSKTLDAYAGNTREVSFGARLDTYEDLSEVLKKLATKVRATCQWVVRPLDQDASLVPRKEYTADFFKYLGERLVPEREYLPLFFDYINAHISADMEEYQIYYDKTREDYECSRKIVEDHFLDPHNILIEYCYRTIPKFYNGFTGLDGNINSISIVHMLKDILYFCSQKGSSCGIAYPILSKCYNQFKVALELRKSIEVVELASRETCEAQAAEVSYIIECQIIDLGPDQELVIPMAFFGHAVLFIIRKEENNLYSFEIINTSNYAGETNFEIINVGTLENPIYRTNAISRKYDNLTLDNLLNPIFWKMLVEYDSIKEHSVSLTEEGVFEFIDIHFTQTCRATRSRGYTYEAQHRGDCSFAALRAWLSIKLPEDIFKEFEYVWTEQACKRLSELAQIDPESAKVIADLKLIELSEETLQQRKELLPAIASSLT